MNPPSPTNAYQRVVQLLFEAESIFGPLVLVTIDDCKIGGMRQIWIAERVSEETLLKFSGPHSGLRQTATSLEGMVAAARRLSTLGKAERAARAIKALSTVPGAVQPPLPTAANEGAQAPCDREAPCPPADDGTAVGGWGGPPEGLGDEAQGDPAAAEPAGPPAQPFDDWLTGYRRRQGMGGPTPRSDGS